MLSRLKSLLPIIFTIYLTVLGLSWLVLHFYIRFMVEKPSYHLSELKTRMSDILYVSFGIFILLHFFLIVLSIIVLIKRRYGVNTKSWLYRASNKINVVVDVLYWKPLEHIHDNLVAYIPGIGTFFLYLETFWQTKGFTYIIIFTLNVLPRILVSMIFLIEIVILGRIHLFVYTVTLLIIPILFNIFLKTFNNFGTWNILTIKEYFDSIVELEDEQYELTVKPEFVDVINPQEEFDLLKQLKHIIDIVELTKETIAYISPYITILTSLIYLMGGIARFVLIIC